MIDSTINDFKEEKITYTEYLVYFDVKDAKKKTEESIEKAQQKWIKKYCEALAKNNLKPIEIFTEADVNKDGVLDLKELEKVLKQYVDSADISYPDLQHIMDAFDVNNDGKVSKSEYETAVNKYAVKPSLAEGSGDVIKAAVKACRDNNTSLKECFSKCGFTDRGNITVVNLQRKIKEGTGFDKKDINTIIQTIKPGENTNITGDEIFEFYDKHLQDETNVILELKYIMIRSKLEESSSILKFLEIELDFDLSSDLLLKEFTTILRDTLHIQKSSCIHLYKEIKTIRPKIPNPNIVDFYSLILNQRDEDLLPNQEVDARNIKQKVIDCNFSPDSEKEQLELYDFIEIFVDVNEIIT